MADPTTTPKPAATSSGLRGFLRENWLYIVIPLGIVFLLLGCVIVFGDESPSKMIYNLF